MVYTDWTASGRLYRPIEEKLCNEFGPFVANTHTETTVSGTAGIANFVEFTCTGATIDDVYAKL